MNEALKELKQAKLKMKSIREGLERRREGYDWNGQRVIDDILISVDQCIESIRVLEETAKERYQFHS